MAFAEMFSLPNSQQQLNEPWSASPPNGRGRGRDYHPNPWLQQVWKTSFPKLLAAKVFCLLQFQIIKLTEKRARYCKLDYDKYQPSQEKFLHLVSGNCFPSFSFSSSCWFRRDLTLIKDLTWTLTPSNSHGLMNQVRSMVLVVLSWTD